VTKEAESESTSSKTGQQIETRGMGEKKKKRWALLDFHAGEKTLIKEKSNKTTEEEGKGRRSSQI